jgi:hypothetical protein
MTRKILLFATVAACLIAANATAQPHAARRELIVCGWDEVFILDPLPPSRRHHSHRR